MSSGDLKFHGHSEFLFLGVNWSGPMTSSTSNHRFYKAWGRPRGPWCKQSLNLLRDMIWAHELLLTVSSSKRKALGRFIVFLVRNYCQWWWSHSNMKKMVVHKKILEVKNELAFPFVDMLLYIEIHVYLIEFKKNSTDSFPYSKCISILDIFLKNWTLILVILNQL